MTGSLESLYMKTAASTSSLKILLQDQYGKTINGGGTTITVTSTSTSIVSLLATASYVWTGTEVGAYVTANSVRVLYNWTAGVTLPNPGSSTYGVTGGTTVGSTNALVIPVITFGDSIFTLSNACWQPDVALARMVALLSGGITVTQTAVAPIIDKVNIGGVEYSVSRAAIALATSGANVVVAADAALKIYLIGLNLTFGLATNWYLTDGAGGTPIHGGSTNKIQTAANGGYVDRNGRIICVTTAATLLGMNMSSVGPCSGSIEYVLAP